MSKKAFDKIAEGLDEVLAVARGEAGPARLYVPNGFDVKALCNKRALSQSDFAAYLGSVVNQSKE